MTNITMIYAVGKLVHCSGQLAQLFSSSVSVGEVWGSIPGPVKSNTVPQTARHRCDVPSKLCCPVAKPQDEPLHS